MGGRGPRQHQRHVRQWRAGRRRIATPSRRRNRRGRRQVALRGGGVTAVIFEPAVRPRRRQQPAIRRWTELALLVAPTALCLCGAVLLSVVWERPIDDPRFRPLLGYVALLIVTHAALVAGRFRGDQLLFPLVGTLTG